MVGIYVLCLSGVGKHRESLMHDEGLAVHLSAKKSALERLDGYRLYLCKSEEDIRHKEDERRVVAETLKKANAENRSLRSDLEAARKRDTE
uniref:Uncharacterized protein n=1 Tax=Oryza rufipogon TaxID=4529 RepID=A0A0E0R6Z7_ORYRU